MAQISSIRLIRGRFSSRSATNTQQGDHRIRICTEKWMLPSSSSCRTLLERKTCWGTLSVWKPTAATRRWGSAPQVAAVFKLANRERIPVTPRGAGYGLSGGAVATQGGIILSLEKMNRILEIDKGNLMVTVEPGVITGDLHRAVEAEGLFYPPDPASLDSCSIGGNIAEGAGGPRAVKYMGRPKTLSVAWKSSCPPATLSRWAANWSRT